MTARFPGMNEMRAVIDRAYSRFRRRPEKLQGLQRVQSCIAAVNVVVDKDLANVRLEFGQ